MSFKIIHEFLNSKSISNEDACNAYLILSDTYKRIFDYDNVLLNLDLAESFANKISNNHQFYLDNVTYQKALALFDTKRYPEAKILMAALAKTGYKNLDAKAQALIIMQEAYLLYVDKKYIEAEKRYDISAEKMRLANPCDLPIIYGKKISLYGAMNKETDMLQAYDLAMHYADSCKISKYDLYVVGVIRKTYKKMGKFKEAVRYYSVYDSLRSIYNAQEYKQKLRELEVKYETNKKEQAINLNVQTIESNRRLIAFLVTAIGALILLVALYVTIQRRRKLVKERQQSQLFTRQLLNKTEEERKRIATDLHDSVNNELLLIKSGLKKNTTSETESNLDALMNQVRLISRNLHPVMFEELGFQDSVEQLAQRVQEHNRFILNTDIDYHCGLNNGDELQLYRIIQEAVNNMLKYSEAQAGIIVIKESNQKLVIEIKDNGKGFDVADALNNKKSFGLHNIIERSKAINGNAVIHTSPMGTTITIEIRIKK